MFGCDKYPRGYPITQGRSSSGVASFGPDGTCHDPKGYGYAAALFFIFFIVLGALILLTLFIGVVNISMEEAKMNLIASKLEAEKLAVVIAKTKVYIYIYTKYPPFICSAEKYTIFSLLFSVLIILFILFLFS